MKNHVAKILCGIALLLPVNIYAGETNALFAPIVVDGKASAMGGIKSLDSAVDYLNSKSLEVSMSTKKQLGIIPYTAYEFKSGSGSFGAGVKIENSEDNLKTSKVSVGLGGDAGFLCIGVGLNLYNAEILSNSVLPEGEFKSKLDSYNISYSAITAKANGMGFDAGAKLELGDIGIAYYMKNLNAKIKWKIKEESENVTKEEENYDENLAIERIIALSYSKNDVSIVAELENFDKINIGFQRNYFNILNLRAGVSRNLKSSDNLKAEKLYSLGVGFEPRLAGIVLGIDFGYQIKYYGRDDLGGGVSQDDMAITTVIKF